MTDLRMRPEAANPRDDTRTRILNAARELFGSQGFDSTTVRQIAKRVGIRDAALYHHFKSKREILNAVWDIPDGGVAAIRANGPLTRARLDEIVRASVEFVAGNDNFQRLTYREILGGDQTALALRQQNRAVLRMTVYEHLKTIHDETEADIRTEAILGLLTGATISAQIEFGQRFGSEAATPDYLDRVCEAAASFAFGHAGAA